MLSDRYIIIEPDETWQLYNWFQHFTPKSIEAELKEAGFAVTQMIDDLTGVTKGEDSIEIVANSL